MKNYLEKYSQEVKTALQNIDFEVFEQVIRQLVQVYKNDAQIIVCGNGGSAGTANHFVCDFGKNAVQDKDKKRFRIFSVCDNVEKITAFGNDVSFEEVFRQQLINFMRPGDALIAISASGNSPDIIRACEYARECGVTVIGLPGPSECRLNGLSDHLFLTPLQTYEQIEDAHLSILHMIVYYFKSHPEILEAQ